MTFKKQTVRCTVVCSAIGQGALSSASVSTQRIVPTAAADIGDGVGCRQKCLHLMRMEQIGNCGIAVIDISEPIFIQCVKITRIEISVGFCDQGGHTDTAHGTRFRRTAEQQVQPVVKGTDTDNISASKITIIAAEYRIEKRSVMLRCRCIGDILFRYRRQTGNELQISMFAQRRPHCSTVDTECIGDHA